MGYNTSASTTTPILTAKLTPIGRQKLILTNNNLIESFSLGDSDANYLASLPLTTGQIVGDGGNLGAFTSTTSNSVGPNYSIKSLLVVNGTGVTKKAIEPLSSNVTIDNIVIGQTTISGTNLSYNIVNRTSGSTDSLVNLYYSFGLPLESNGDYRFTGTTAAYGGFSDTALSAIAQTNILVIGIDNTKYGEVIDGKTIKLNLSTLISAYTIYSTFQNAGLATSVQDANLTDTATNTQFINNNIAFLVSDNVKRPNGDSTLSWATGYGLTKPFSVNQKKLYNFSTNSNVSQTADTIVGIAYLDKGFLVITDQTIVNNYSASAATATTLTLNSVSTSVVQNVTCIANRGEFGNSTNRTFVTTDTPRISEVGLYDIDGDLIAIAKTDRHITKNVNEFLALGIKIAV